MRSLTLILFCFLCTPGGSAQNINQSVAPVPYGIPFDSNGNVIELSFVNADAIEGGQVHLEVLAAPEWIDIRSQGQRDVRLADNRTEQIIFDVPVDAPIGETGAITIKITAVNGLTWYKEIEIEVEPPQSFALRNGYPNPFNPAATIPFVVPETARVRVVAYDILGRMVSVISDDVFEPGLHNARFDGSYLASGMYLIRATMESEANGTVSASVRRLTLLK